MTNPFKILYFIAFCLTLAGCGSEEYDYSNMGVGVSKRTVAVLQGENLDLSSELDPAQVPEIVKEAYLEGADLKKEGKELVQFVIQDISTKIAQISSIDLNEDSIPDPILIVPEGNSESMTFSVRIPDPGQVKSYPDNPNEWQNIAENKAIEVLSVTVFPRKGNGKNPNFDVEARPNRQVYEGHHHHHYHSSFMHTYLTMHMMNSMFFSPFGWYGPGFYGRMGYYGRGYYGNNYGGRSVSSTKTTRRTYKKSKASSTPLKTNSGKTVRSSLASQKSSAVKSYKSSAIQKRNTATAKRATGFGSSRKSASSKSSSSKSSSWGRSYNRSSSWGGGSRGFGK
ncbi:MAG: hypothetical protein HQL32_07645 [Planctomycetes bacterium]|nr:hypothetical protein [Planctomycetota bacterium]